MEIGEIAVPITTKADRDSRVTIHTVTGEPSYEEIMDVLTSFYGKHPTKNSLWDIRSTSLVRLSNKDLQFFADYSLWYGWVRAGGKTAFVVSNDIDYGILRMKEAYGKYAGFPFMIKVFHSMDEAIKWIGKEG